MSGERKFCCEKCGMTFVVAPPARSDTERTHCVERECGLRIWHADRKPYPVRVGVEEADLVQHFGLSSAADLAELVG